jgi:signal transduction histidine kinase
LPLDLGALFDSDLRPLGLVRTADAADVTVNREAANRYFDGATTVPWSAFVAVATEDATHADRLRAATHQVFADGEAATVELGGRSVSGVTTVQLFPLRDDAVVAVVFALEPASLDERWIDRLGHDLRGPISPMHTMVQLIRGGRMTAEKSVDALALITRQAERLLELIDDVADLARQRHGRVPTLASVDLRSIVDMVCVRHGRLAGDAGVRLRADLPPDPVFVEADTRRLTRLLAMPVTRAIEAARRGQTIAVALHAESGAAVIGVRYADGEDDATTTRALVDELSNIDPAGIAATLVQRTLAMHRAVLALSVDGDAAVRVTMPIADDETASRP